MKAALVILALALAACGVSGRTGGSGGAGICPAHPDQCAGKCCGTTCFDVMHDPFNCGDCGVACPAGTICLGGNCGCPPFGDKCGLGQTCCGAIGCVSLDSDIRNCGACGDSCAGDSKHACVGADCCYDGFLAGSCASSTSCGMWIYP